MAEAEAQLNMDLETEVLLTHRRSVQFTRTTTEHRTGTATMGTTDPTGMDKTDHPTATRKLPRAAGAGLQHEASRHQHEARNVRQEGRALRQLLPTD